MMTMRKMLSLTVSGTLVLSSLVPAFAADGVVRGQGQAPVVIPVVNVNAALNGITLYGSFRAFGSTFLIFSDYMRPAIRLAALMHIPSIFVYTHDSVFLGEDGPTHQSIEQLASLRLIPNMTLFRPADGAETAMAWAYAIGSKHDGPTIIVCTRQKLEPIVRGAAFDAHDIWRGAYVLDGYADGDLTFIATGSEVSLAIKTAELLRSQGTRARVVSVTYFGHDAVARLAVEYEGGEVELTARTRGDLTPSAGAHVTVACDGFVRVY